MAGDQIGRHGDEPARQPLHGAGTQVEIELAHQALAADQAWQAHPEIHVADHFEARHGPRPGLQLVQLSGQETAAHDGADRGAADDVGFDAGGLEGANDAYMGPSAGDAAPQRQADLRSIHAIASRKAGTLWVSPWDESPDGAP